MRKAHFAGVRSWAAMMRSPSFSRFVASRTMRGWPFPERDGGISGGSGVDKRVEGRTEGLDGRGDAVEVVRAVGRRHTAWRDPVRVLC